MKKKEANGGKRKRDTGPCSTTKAKTNGIGRMREKMDDEKKRDQHKERPGHIHERQQKKSLVGIKKKLKLTRPYSTPILFFPSRGQNIFALPVYIEPPLSYLAV